MSKEEIAAVFERMLRESNFSQEEKRCAANILGQISANESLELEAGESAQRSGYLICRPGARGFAILGGRLTA